MGVIAKVGVIRVFTLQPFNPGDTIALFGGEWENRLVCVIGGLL